MPYALLFYFCSVYVTRGRVDLSLGVILSEPVFILLSLWIMEHCFPSQFWWFFTIGVVIALAGCLLTSWLITRHNSLLDRFTLVPKGINVPCVDFSVTYNQSNSYAAFLHILQFLKICEMPKMLSTRVAICVEDIMNVIVCAKVNDDHQDKHYFDIRVMEIMDDDDRQSRGIQVFVKTGGKSSNPVRDISLNPTTLSKGNDLPLLLVNKLCDDIDYNYRNGVNCVVMKFYNN